MGMSFDGWIIFASFWALFVTTPGPNAVNCISVAMAYGLRMSLICVAAILTQASLFLAVSAFGITALIAASPAALQGWLSPRLRSLLRVRRAQHAWQGSLLCPSVSGLGYLSSLLSRLWSPRPLVPW